MNGRRGAGSGGSDGATKGLGSGRGRDQSTYPVAALRLPRSTIWQAFSLRKSRQVLLRSTVPYIMRITNDEWPIACVSNTVGAE